MRKIDHPQFNREYKHWYPLSEKLYLVMPVADYGECMSFDGPIYLLYLIID